MTISHQAECVSSKGRPEKAGALMTEVTASIPPVNEVNTPLAAVSVLHVNRSIQQRKGNSRPGDHGIAPTTKQTVLVCIGSPIRGQCEKDKTTRFCSSIANRRYKCHLPHVCLSCHRPANISCTEGEGERVPLFRYPGSMIGMQTSWSAGAYIGTSSAVESDRNRKGRRKMYR